MTRRRSDSNQAGIIAALRAAGATVFDLAGHGRRLTPAERDFITSWRGQVVTVTDITGALALLDNNQ